jgi:hypothetical protein
MNSSPLLTVDISKKETLEFYEHYLIYKGDKFFYREFDGLSYIYTRTSTSIYFIPVGTSHSYNVSFRENGKEHKMIFSSEEKYDVFVKICGAFESVIKKFILTNLLLEYGEKGGLEIAGLKINSQGISKRKIFGRLDTLPWLDLYNSECKAGSLFIYQKYKEKYKVFFSCQMFKMNAVILPDLLKFLFDVNGMVDKAMLNELLKKRDEWAKPSATVATVKLCSTCNEPVRNDMQKFCAKCGSKLND